MPFVDGLYTFLSTAPGITALTGSGLSARVYPLVPPQLEKNEVLQPTVVFGQVSRQDIDTLKETGKRRTEFEILSVALTHSAAHSLNDAIEAALNHYTGAMGDYTCHRANLQDTSDEVIPDLKTYTVASRYLIFHN